MAQSKMVQITIPIRDAVMKSSLNNDRHSVAFKICSIVDSTVIAESISIFTPGVDPSTMMKNPGGEYIVKVMVYDTDKGADGRLERTESTKYEPVSWHNIFIPDGVTQITIDPIYISLKRHIELDEVSVTASKVMFYHNGDTLIFNADAFILPQGSMLDALIEQLPGVKISSTGVIYCNDRRIDNLLLNGKDLFNGNQKLMLDNLGAYTIKDIAVYNKKGHLSEMFNENMGDALYVMDVRLKREYQYGYLLNLEGGYGTENRYLSRLFGMLFTDNFSSTVYGNANNLDDKGTPGRDDSAWSYNQSGTGVASVQNGGMSYYFQVPDSKLELKGDMGVEYSDNLSTTSSLRQSFFTTGDVFSYSHKHKNDRVFSVKSAHKLFFKAGKRVLFNFLPKFEYSRKNDYASAIDISMNEELHEVSLDILESIYEDASAYKTKVINRSRTNDLCKGKKIECFFEASTDIKLNSLNQQPLLLSLKGSAFLNRIHNDYFSKYVIKSEAMSKPYYNANRYTKGYPTRKELYSGMIELSKSLSYGRFSGVLKFNYTFDRTNDEVTSSMFLLNLIPGYEDFGTLPSVTEYAPTYSPLDSYHTSAAYNRHHIEAKLESAQFMTIGGGSPIYFRASLPMDIYDRNFLYDGRSEYQKINRINYIMNGSVGAYCFLPKRHFVQLILRTESVPNNMIDLISVTNDNDPLNIFTGNADLQNPRKYEINFQFKIDRITSKHNLYFDWEKTINAIALGYLYNPVSGVRTGRMLNIDGNWQTIGTYEFNTYFGSFTKPRLSMITTGSYRRSVDYFGTTMLDTFSDIPLRTVNTVTVKEDARLDWQTGKHRLSAFCDVKFNRYLSKDSGFTNFNSWNFNVGATAVVYLPYEWGISTDLALHKRNGYTDLRLNTTDVIWNARVSKSILKGAVIFILDSFDILHHLSNINYTVNAQARTETVSNVVPSYAILHIRWNINKQPGRK